MDNNSELPKELENKFDTNRARELASHETVPGLEQALKLRLNAACDEIDRLREILKETQ